MRVLAFHRTPPVDRFRECLTILRAQGPALGPQDLAQALVRGRCEHPRSFLVTFDDAYRDFATRAWPILRELGIPAMLFVPTSFPDSGRAFWWDQLESALRTTQRSSVELFGREFALGDPGRFRDDWRTIRTLVKDAPHQQAMQAVQRALEQLGTEVIASDVLGWDELRELHRQGLHIGAHTREHAMLPGLSYSEQLAEICGSCDDLERRLGHRPTWFAYPSGRYDARSVQAVRECGLELAFTTVDGEVDLRRAAAHEIQRIDIGTRDGAGTLAAKLLRARSKRGAAPIVGQRGPA